MPDHLMEIDWSAQPATITREDVETQPEPPKDSCLISVVSSGSGSESEARPSCLEAFEVRLEGSVGGCEQARQSVDEHEATATLKDLAPIPSHGTGGMKALTGLRPNPEDVAPSQKDPPPIMEDAAPSQRSPTNRGRCCTEPQRSPTKHGRCCTEPQRSPTRRSSSWQSRYRN